MPDLLRNELKDKAQVDTIVLTSTQQPKQNFLIFKHSTRCSISQMALGRLKKSNLIQAEIFFYLDLLSYRDVSNYISQVFSITHESPQLLLINNGRCAAFASHSEISETWLENYFGNQPSELNRACC